MSFSLNVQPNENEPLRANAHSYVGGSDPFVTLNIGIQRNEVAVFIHNEADAQLLLDAAIDTLKKIRDIEFAKKINKAIGDDIQSYFDQNVVTADVVRSNCFEAPAQEINPGWDDVPGGNWEEPEDEPTDDFRGGYIDSGYKSWTSARDCTINTPCSECVAYGLGETDY